jgi:two-component system, NarL family, invasion response regulator UvrY
MRVASVLVVEDDAFSRTLMVNVLEAATVHVVHATGNAAEAARVLKQSPCDVALLDLDLGPGPTGFDLAVVLRREAPRIGVVFLTSYLDPRLVGVEKGLIPVGSRFLRKSELDDAGILVKTVVSAAHKPLAPQKYSFGAGPGLTDNQLAVLSMVASGKSTKDIASQLGVSDKAVEASISRIHRVVEGSSGPGSGTRVGLVRAFYAITGRTPPRG